MLLALSPARGALAQESDGAPASAQLAGLTVREVLHRYSDQGYEFIFSSDYVTPELRVLVEPTSSDPEQIFAEILRPHGLEVRKAGDKYLIVRAAGPPGQAPAPVLLVLVRDAHSQSPIESAAVSASPSIAGVENFGRGVFSFNPGNPGRYQVEVRAPGYAPGLATVEVSAGKTAVVTVELEPGPLQLENLSVTASRYVLFSNSMFFIDQRAIQSLPKLGDDPIRSVQRLQGSAANGLSARTHFRGGAYDETSIYLNGLRLLDPFHIRDYHSIFSTIDARAISGIEVYTGGFPSEFGDDMSGLIVLDSRQPEAPLHSEIGVSLFNTSLLNSGYLQDGRYDWLVSARRSNLDLVLNEDLGEPNYFDVFASLGINPNDHTRISLNGFLADDEVYIITENEPGELEQSTSNTNNTSFWIRAETDWNDILSSDTILSASDFSNRRIASVQEPETMISAVHDYRKAEILALRHDMSYTGLAGHTLRWGLEVSRQKARYDYSGGAEYFGFAAATPGLTNPVSYEVMARPSGYTYGLFASDRFALSDRLTMELGLRWDRQTYTEPVYSSQFSPRASLLFDAGNRRNFRLTVGRYSQAQAIQELQVEDDISRFNPPQRADQFIAGYQWATANDYQFRIEAYYKDYDRVAMRFENLFDPLQLVPEFQPDRVGLSPDTARAKGLELSVEHTASDQLNWWASYTLSRVSDTIDGSKQLRSWDQLHALQAGLGWSSGPWELGIAGRIHSGWPTTSLSLEFDAETGQQVPVPGPRNAENFGVFASIDFRLSRTFDVSKGQLMGFIEITNTTNRQNSCCTDYTSQTDSNGNAWLVGDTEYWLPILPSIGLLWEF